MFSYLSSLSDSNFNIFQDSVLNLLLTKIADWNLSPAAVNDLNVIRHQWIDAYQKFVDPATRSYSNRFAKNEARKKFELLLTDMIKKSIYGNPAVTLQDLADMYLPTDGVFTHRKSKFNTHLRPALNYQINITGLIVMFASVQGVGKIGKPSHTAKIQYKFAEQGQPLDEKSGYEQISSKARTTLKLPADLKGKAITVIARWITSTGEYTDFSDPVNFYTK